MLSNYASLYDGLCILLCIMFKLVLISAFIPVYVHGAVCPYVFPECISVWSRPLRRSKGRGRDSKLGKNPKCSKGTKGCILKYMQTVAPMDYSLLALQFLLFNVSKGFLI